MSGPVAGSAVIFAYDGISRRTKITEFTNGTMTSKKLYFWLGGSIVCERDGLQTGFPITKQYFGQGEVRGATKLYYTFDHLGSIRELVDSAGTVQAEYSYSTYGERTKASGNLDSDWGYAGLWHHAPSGLDLATYRAYDAANKRWISRDPLGEGVDYNLYRYCGNSPINNVDPSGLDPWYKDPTFKNKKLAPASRYKPAKLQECPARQPQPPNAIDYVVMGTMATAGAIVLGPEILMGLADALPAAPSATALEVSTGTGAEATAVEGVLTGTSEATTAGGRVLPNFLGE